MTLTHNNDTCIHPCGLQIRVRLGTTELLQSDHINHRCNLCLVPPAVITAPIPERMMVHWSSLMWGNVQLVSDIKRLVCREGDRPFMTCGPNKNNYCNFNGFVCYSGLTEVDQPIMLLTSHTQKTFWLIYIMGTQSRLRHLSDLMSSTWEICCILDDSGSLGHGVRRKTRSEARKLPHQRAYSTKSTSPNLFQ